MQHLLARAHRAKSESEREKGGEMRRCVVARAPWLCGLRGLVVICADALRAIAQLATLAACPGGAMHVARCAASIRIAVDAGADQQAVKVAGRIRAGLVALRAFGEADWPRLRVWRDRRVHRAAVEARRGTSQLAWCHLPAQPAVRAGAAATAAQHSRERGRLVGGVSDVCSAVCVFLVPTSCHLLLVRRTERSVEARGWTLLPLLSVF